MLVTGIASCISSDALRLDEVAVQCFCYHWFVFAQINTPQLPRTLSQSQVSPSISEQPGRWCRDRHEGSPHPASQRHGQTAPPSALLPRPALEVSQPFPGPATPQPSGEPRQVWSARWVFSQLQKLNIKSGRWRAVTIRQLTSVGMIFYTVFKHNNRSFSQRFNIS